MELCHLQCCLFDSFVGLCVLRIQKSGVSIYCGAVDGSVLRENFIERFQPTLLSVVLPTLQYVSKESLKVITFSTEISNTIMAILGIKIIIRI